LDKHLENLRQRFGLPAAVAVNRFPTDTDAELSLIQAHCQALGVPAALTEVWGKGGAGGETLAKEVVRLCGGSAPTGPNFLYPDELPLEEKITRIASEIYGGGAVFAPAARKELERLTQLGYGHLPVCMAKTQYSLSDDPKLLARPTGFQITVRSVRLSAGAGFVVALTGDIMTMPGLSKSPAAERIDVSPEGEITGLF
jgi:formate--tetrahydrofolate ligase